MHRYTRRLQERAPARPSSFRFLLPLCLFAASLLVACDPQPPPPVPQSTASPPPPTPTVPDRPRSGTITVRLTGDVRSLNPWFAGFDADTQDVTGAIFSGLTHLDNHMQPQPDLAESWDVSPDGTQLTFRLR